MSFFNLFKRKVAKYRLIIAYKKAIKMGSFDKIKKGLINIFNYLNLNKSNLNQKLRAKTLLIK